MENKTCCEKCAFIKEFNGNSNYCDNICPCHSIKPPIEEVDNELTIEKPEEDSGDWEEILDKDWLKAIEQGVVGWNPKHIRNWFVNKFRHILKSQKDKSYEEGQESAMKIKLSNFQTNQLENIKKEAKAEALTHFKEVVEIKRLKPDIENPTLLDREEISYNQALDDILQELTKEQNKCKY